MLSIMKAIIGTVILTLSTVSADRVIAGKCDMATFYLELGCTPVPSADNGTCPESFTCPELHPDPTSCYYKGVAYADQATIPQNLIDYPCAQACRCSAYNNQPPSFECAAVDCFELFHRDLNQQCMPTYQLDSCCSGRVCGKDAIAQLKTCEVDGSIYREGQMFEPANTWKRCICTAEWDGNTNNRTFCRYINCGIEIYYQNYIFRKCVPIFLQDSRGCPIPRFVCPSTTTKLIRGLNIKRLSGQCVFGNMTLTIGDEVSVPKDQCAKCTCSVPPYVSCIRKLSCDS